jgi:hypothetical protein
LGVPGLFARRWVHRAAGGDSGDLIDPFMRVGTYPTRHLATLSNHRLWLDYIFTPPSILWEVAECPAYSL